MRKLISAAMVAVLLASAGQHRRRRAAGHRHHGSGYGHSYYAGHNFKHRPYYGYRYRNPISTVTVL